MVAFGGVPGPRRHLLASLALAGAGALAACDDGGASDTFPILVERVDGAFVVQLRADGEAARTAVVDVLSPLTVLDQPAELPPVRRTVTLDLLAPRSLADPTPIVRTRWSTKVLDLHPCAAGTTCQIGAAGAPRDIGAVLGADVLRGHAIRFEPAADRIFVLPDIAGSEVARGEACDVVVPEPFYGGGTLQVGDTELGFAGTRIALGVCLSPRPDAVDPTARGTDAALVLSTGVGISVLGAARYTAWAQATGGPALDTLPPATALLPSGPVTGRLARIDRLSIVGTSTAPRGACREIYLHHIAAERDCTAADGEDCTCTQSNLEGCKLAAIAELAPTTPIEVVVVSDEDPLLQALRAELRPEQPEVDGILGVNALATTALDVDYPNNRLLVRCVAAGCVARPKMITTASRDTIQRCVAAAPTVP